VENFPKCLAVWIFFRNFGYNQTSKNMCTKKYVKLKMIKCIKCNGPMPELRLIKFGYRNCVNCSTVERVGGVAIANHKTGNEIQIMPAKDAARLYKLSQRQGYGVCKGMKHN
jgi:hypothetical protein